MLSLPWEKENNGNFRACEHSFKRPSVCPSVSFLFFSFVRCFWVASLIPHWLPRWFNRPFHSFIFFFCLFTHLFIHSFRCVFGYFLQSQCGSWIVISQSRVVGPVGLYWPRAVLRAATEQRYCHVLALIPSLNMAENFVRETHRGDKCAHRSLVQVSKLCFCQRASYNRWLILLSAAHVHVSIQGSSSPIHPFIRQTSTHSLTWI